MFGVLDAMKPEIYLWSSALFLILSGAEVVNRRINPTDLWGSRLMSGLDLAMSLAFLFAWCKATQGA